MWEVTQADSGLTFINKTGLEKIDMYKRPYL